jgi:hypothetical protein
MVDLSTQAIRHDTYRTFTQPTAVFIRSTQYNHIWEFFLPLNQLRGPSLGGTINNNNRKNNINFRLAGSKNKTASEVS